MLCSDLFFHLNYSAILGASFAKRMAGKFASFVALQSTILFEVVTFRNRGYCIRLSGSAVNFFICGKAFVARFVHCYASHVW